MEHDVKKQIGEIGMQLQARDKEILQCCYEQQFLVASQVQQYFFPNKKRAHWVRLWELERGGFIELNRRLKLHGHSLIRVTKDGRRIARELSAFDVPQTRSLDIATLEHDAIVTSVRLRLSQLWDGLWMPEKALKDRYRQIPDGIFQFEGSGKIVAIEVENSLKGKSRFVALLRGWRDIPGISLVLYVATSPRIASAVAGHFSEAPPRPPMAVVEWKSLEQGTPMAQSPAGELELFNRRRV